MLTWTFIFLILAVIAGVLGFSGFVGSVGVIAQVLAGLFLVLSIGSLIDQQLHRKNF